MLDVESCSGVLFSAGLEKTLLLRSDFTFALFRKRGGYHYYDNNSAAKRVVTTVTVNIVFTQERVFLICFLF